MVVIGNSGVLAPGRWRWLRALAWMVALFVIVVMAFSQIADGALRVAALAGDQPFTTAKAAPQAHKLMAIAIAALAALFAYWGAVRLAERRPVTELAIRPLVPDLAIGIAVGAAQMTLIVGLLWACGWVSVSVQEVTSVARALRETIQSGVLEEILFRLIIFRLLWRALGVWPALVLAAGLFGAAHLVNPDADLFAAASLIAGEGVGIGLYLLTGRLWASIGAHAAWNFTMGWVFGSAVSGTTGIAGGPLSTVPVPGVAELLSGGGFGPEGSVAAFAVSLAASVIMLRLAWIRGCLVAADPAENYSSRKAATSS